ncbi:hypothetical protein EKK58_05300 [Candidatus Dependentiae bacterium]|nr:MAG: hypothetical protein EKK58_05300 [Candidatus Dependentiae bacterium]
MPPRLNIHQARTRTPDAKEEKQIAARAKKARKLVNGTSAGPWVRWKGHPHVMQGPAQENTESCFHGSIPHGDGTIAECDSDPSIPDRRARKNATFIAASRELMPALGEDVEWLLRRLDEYRAAVLEHVRNPSANAPLNTMHDLLREDGFEVP